MGAVGVEALRCGLSDIIPAALLRGFSPADLRRAVCGVPDLDAALWRAATRHSEFGTDQYIALATSSITY